MPSRRLLRNYAVFSNKDRLLIQPVNRLTVSILTSRMSAVAVLRLCLGVDRQERIFDKGGWKGAAVSETACYFLIVISFILGAGIGVMLSPKRKQEAS